MNIHAGIFTTSLVIPILLLVASLAGTIFFMAQGKEYAVGMLIGGGFYAFIAFCITLPSTYLFGFPLSLIALKKKKTSILFAAFMGALFGAVAFCLAATIVGMQIFKDSFFFIVAIPGAIGGFINGLVLWRLVILPNKQMQTDAAKAAPLI